jgi:hypothetical protein
MQKTIKRYIRELKKNHATFFTLYTLEFFSVYRDKESIILKHHNDWNPLKGDPNQKLILFSPILLLKYRKFFLERWFSEKRLNQNPPCWEFKRLTTTETGQTKTEPTRPLK